MPFQQRPNVPPEARLLYACGIHLASVLSRDAHFYPHPGGNER